MTRSDRTLACRRAEPELLTLHRERVGRLDGFYDIDRIAADGQALTHLQHWLFRAAIDARAVTWSIERWGRPEFVAVFAQANRHELELAIVYDVRSAPPVLSGETTSYPADVGSMSAEAIAQLPSTLVPDPPTELAWLTYLVGRFNDLHRRTAALVAGWPRCS